MNKEMHIYTYSGTCYKKKNKKKFSLHLNRVYQTGEEQVFARCLYRRLVIYNLHFRYLLTILKSEYLSIFTIMVCNLCSFQKTIACHLRIAYVKDIFELGIIQCMVNVILVNLSFLTTTQKHLSAEILVTSSFLINNYRNIF